MLERPRTRPALPQWLTTKVAAVAVLTATVCVPLFVGLVALGRIHWSPVLDLAMTELRVRDVGTRHTPQIGLPGRIGTFPNQGSHPGPLSFYLLAPTYRVLGSTSWSLEVGAVLIHTAAVTAVLVLAYRRGGPRLCLAVAAMMAVILRGYGANVLTQPWNPYLPVLAWMVVLLAAWSVLEGDAVAMVYFVVAGTFCAQTHVPYVGLVGGLGVLTLAWLILRANVGRLASWNVEMPGLKRWSITAAVVGVVLWVPPVVDQIRHTPGNLSMLNDYFRNPPEQSIGFGKGVERLLEHLNVFRLIGTAFQHSDYFKTTALTFPVPTGFPTASAIPGVIVLMIWAVCVVQAVRLRHRALIHLHAVIGAGLLLGLIATIRIFGIVWYYLTFWAWALVALMVLAMLWTAIETARRVWEARREQITRAVGWVAAGVLAVSSLTFIWSAAHVEPPENYLSESLGAVVGPTAEALDARVGAATGHDGHYQVTWTDVAYFGSQGFGLVNELERRGFDAGAHNLFRVPITPQRVMDAASSTAEVHLATGAYIDEWRQKPGVVEVAYTDPRNSAERAQYDEWKSEADTKLRELGLADLADQLDTNLFGVQLDARVPRSVNEIIDRMLQLGQPTAVFIAPPGTSN
jgi:hypothetical protein